MAEVMRVQWARDHLKFGPDLSQWEGERGIHYFSYDPPIACPDCDGTGSRPCRGHTHDCDWCRGSGKTNHYYGHSTECPLCWDQMFENLARGFENWFEARRRLENQQKQGLAERLAEL